MAPSCASRRPTCRSRSRRRSSRPCCRRSTTSGRRAVSSSSTETLVDVTMPQMGVSVAEGTVVEWKKQAGDWVEADEVIASISTDKIDTDVESPASGRVAEIVVNVGDTVDVGTAPARIATDARPGQPHVSENGVPETGTGEATAALEAPGGAGELQGDTEETHEESEQRPRPRRDGARRYSPVVTRIAAEHGVDLERVEGTGRGGRVRKQDVLAFIEGGGAEEPPMHIESPYRPDEPSAPKPRRARLSRIEEVPRGPAAPGAASGSSSGGPPPPRAACRGCARRSASGWWSRCRPRRRAPPSP